MHTHAHLCREKIKETVNPMWVEMRESVGDRASSASKSANQRRDDLHFPDYISMYFACSAYFAASEGAVGSMASGCNQSPSESGELAELYLSRLDICVKSERSPAIV